ncbi:MAG: hypothetical protein COB04_16190 [Gammaproteobacteria bacterium]|nr:MAG: hypothetical protein COB04_16190 [Gammaproteobacteria bacterium]
MNKSPNSAFTIPKTWAEKEMKRMQIVFPAVAYEKLEQTIASAERMEMGRQSVLGAWCDIPQSESDRKPRAQRPASSSRSVFEDESDVFCPIVCSDR